MNKEKNTEKLLRVEDVAAILSIKPITVYLWSWQGKIKSIKIGRLVRFREADIQRFIESAEAVSKRQV